MNVSVPDLHEDRAAFGQQIARHGQAVAQVGEVGVDAVAPGVAEGLDLLRLARDVIGLSIAHVAAGGGPLKVGVELDAVGRVDVDALHLAAQPLALGQRGHHLQAVAEDHAVRPVGVVAVELGPGLLGGQAVEVGEQIGEAGAAGSRRGARALALPHQVVDQHLGMDALLDVERRCVDDELGPVLQVFAAPDQLRVEVAVAPLVGDLQRALLLLLHQRLVLGAGQVPAAGVLVPDRLHPLRLARLGSSCHSLSPVWRWPAKSAC